MKKLFSNRINTSTLILILIVGYIAGNELNPVFGIWIGISLVVLFLIYLLKELKAKRQIGLAIISIFMGGLIILLNYFEINKLNNDLLMPFIPLILIILFVYAYNVVVRKGDEEAIKKVKIGIWIGIPAGIVMLLLMLYAAIFL